MKICLVTTFPPSRGGLSEYGFHVARELQQNQFLSVSILADELPSPHPELDGFSVNRCWRFDDPNSPRRLLKVIRELDPDVVWFNLIFTTFGHRPTTAFYGLTLPLLSRLMGYHTHVTLHHLMEALDLKGAGIRFPWAYRAAGVVATRMLLMSHSVSVLMPAYRRSLLQKYGSQNVQVRAHGIFSSSPQYPDFSIRGTPVHRILAFGKWGTYKRLELMLQAFPLIVEQIPNAQLVVAGGDHPRTPGYVASQASRVQGDSRIHFTGYVPEEEIGPLFSGASVAVMPYSSATGSSGIAHLACAYGVPIVCADLPDFREMAEDEGLAVEFHQLDNARELADRVIDLLQSQQKQRAMAEQNFSAALRMTMPQIIHGYLRHFDRERRTKTLKRITRLRRWPRWLPWQFILDRMGPSVNWSERPAIVVPAQKPSDAALQQEKERQAGAVAGGKE
jgi:glycosyltransferase involved in cell wall biosynthesis